jgi:hypothetical protein
MGIADGLPLKPARQKAPDPPAPVGVIGQIVSAENFTSQRDALVDSHVPRGGAGVVGTGVVGVVGATGYGSESDAAGVAGFNAADGYGGLFQSAKGAALHLEPTKGLGAPPREGRAGDLLVIPRQGSPNSEMALWMCTRGSAQGRAACWRRVAFDQSSGEGCDKF